MRKRGKKINRWNILTKFFAVIVLFIVFIILLFFIPDLIIKFRNFLYNKFDLKQNLELNTNSYIQAIISIFSCCITAILGLCTFFLTKILRKMETERHNAKLATASFRLYKNVKHNCWIIFNANKNIESLKKLQYQLDLDESWFVLSAAGELNNDELKFLKNYDKQIQEIHMYFEEGENTKELERKFCNSFLNSENEFEYNDDSKKVINKLEEIMNRRIFE